MILVINQQMKSLMDDLMSHDETPAEDFEFNDSTDNIIIEKYVGKDPIVVIPDEIDGKKVVDFMILLRMIKIL